MISPRKHSAVVPALLCAAGLFVVAGCGFIQTNGGGAGRELPNVIDAAALSRHYVELTFASAPGDEAEQVDRYRIVDPDGIDLRIRRATVQADPAVVLLTTDALGGVAYQLTILPADPGAQAAEAETFTFTGSTLPEPALERAVALSTTTVLLTFSELMDAATTESVDAYAIHAASGDPGVDLDVQSAVRGSDTTMVVLTTAPQEAIAYTVVVSDVLTRRGLSRELLIDPTRESAIFDGVPAVDTIAPRVTGAAAGGRTTVVVSFSEPLNEEADDPTHYRIEPELAITDVASSAHGAQMVLTTVAQVPGQTYTLSVEGVRDIANNLIDPIANTATFVGTARELFLESAVALSNTTILVTFNEPPNLNTALNTSFYEIGDADDSPDVDLSIVGAEPDSDDSRAIILTTTTQAHAQYRIRATNIRAGRDSFLIDPARSDGTFFGIAAEDLIGPTLERAASTSSTTVLLTFSEPLDPDAADPVNFSIECDAGSAELQLCSPSLLVLDASITAHNTQIILLTHPQVAAVEYTVTAANVNGEFTDLSVNRNPLTQTPSQATFTFAGQPSLEPAMVLPRVVGAASQGNTSVLVTFSKPMGGSALTASNYIIVQENVNTEVGALQVLANACNAASPNSGDSCVDDGDCLGGHCLVRDPRFHGEDRTSVLLTTTSQNEVTYRVTVVNVKDLAGNQLAPKELLVDPTSATFPGTPASGGQIVDSDGDGLSDSAELRGRTITVVLTGGEVTHTEVTSDPFSPDTDNDGLSDLEEKRLNTNPRSSDTDGDQLSDFDEYNVWYTSPVHQDTDADALDDHLEVAFFKTSPLLPDTDGDGLDDDHEVITGNRDPRIADLPDPGVDIGQVALRLDTRFSYTDTRGESSTTSKSTSSALAQSESRTLATSDTSTTQHAVSASAEFGLEASITPKKTFKASIGYSYTRGNTFTVSESSTRDTQEQYQQSLTTDVSRDVTQAVTRTVEGASVEVLVTVNNGGDIPFTLRNLQLTGLLQDPFIRNRFLPVATMLPASVLEGGGTFEVFLGPFIPERGPFVFKNAEVFPSLVEDLMKNPRGLIFTVANFDIEDEDGRNFAFISQDVNDRTAGVIIDYGNGTVDRFRVSTHSPFGNDGRPAGITMAYALQDILGFTKNGPTDAITVGPNGCGETWAIGDDIQVSQPICLPVPVGGVIIEPGPNGILETIPAGDDRKSDSGLSIVDGGDGCAHTRASRDDIQVVPGDCQKGFPDGVMVLPGPNGVFETVPAADDVEGTVTGYGTQMAGECDGNTDTLIEPGRNELLDSIPVGDDEVSSGNVLPGTNGILETATRGDDIRRGPGYGCAMDDDCPGDGSCRFVEQLTRVQGVRNIPVERRFWIIMSAADIPPGRDFDDIVLRPGDVFSLAYVQDKDADGLIAREEFLYGSSDRDVNSDGCPLGDGAPGCDINVFDFDTVRDFEEVKHGWIVEVAGRSTYASFPNPIQPDTDADRLFDDEEQTIGTDPGKRDSDDDEISDFDEVRGYDIVRRDGTLIRHVVPYQSAYIAPGADGELDTHRVGDDLNLPVWKIITPGPNGVLDSIPEDDDVLTPSRLILDGGNGVPETPASGDDVQVGPSPVSTTTITVTFLDYRANGDACDDLQDGEFSFDLRLRRNVETIVGQLVQNATVARTVAHHFDGAIFAGPNGRADTPAAGDDEQVASVGAAIAPNEIVVHPGPNGVLDTLPFGDDVRVGPGDGGNRFTLALEPGDSISISGTVQERDDVCSAATRVAVVESGTVIAEPLSGGNGMADSMVPQGAGGFALNDDVQELAPGSPVLPGQVIISAGANGVLETGTDGDDVVPFGNGFADTQAPDGDVQVVELGGAVQSGDMIVSCGPDGEPAMGLAPATPGICEAVIVRTAAGDGTADSAAAGDDFQVINPGEAVAVGDVVVRAGPNGAIDTVPGGAVEEILGARAPFACAEVIVQSVSAGVGVVETSASGDDDQFLGVGAAAFGGQIVIGPGANGVVDSIVAVNAIVEPAGGNGTADTTAMGDDIQVAAVAGAVFEGDLIVAPGPNGVIDTAVGGDDVVSPADDELVPAQLPPGDDCIACPLGFCVVECTLCATGTCVGDDVLFARTPGQSCDDGFCPCGSCVAGSVVEWALPPRSFDLAELLATTGGEGSTIVTFSEGPNCFSVADLNVRIDVSAGVTVEPGAVLVRPGANGTLDSEPKGDDFVGAPHLKLYATNPLDRDTDADTLFDGAEAKLGANPNDPLDASRFRDNDLDGLANIEETDGWFVGYRNESLPGNPLQCRTSDGSFLSVPDEFNPPAECVIVTSDRFEPDTDFDGLPDLLEFLIRSDPRSSDTDGDGLLDLDEFDPQSRFSVDIGVYREFERRCANADRCSFTPVEAPFGTSVVLPDTDFDGRDDYQELFESWIILPCVDGDQLPLEVFSSPLSPDADHDGVLDGAEEDQGTDPNNPDTDGDGKVDNPSVDPQPDGCGKVVTVSFVDYRTTDDCDPGGQDGEFRFRFTVSTPRGRFSFSQNNDDLDDNRTHTFSSNQARFLLTPGESFTISGHVWEADSSSGDEDWYFSRTYSFESLPAGPTIIGPRPGEADDNCFDGHQLQVNVTSTGA